MPTSCPDCGAPVRAIVGRVRPVREMPEFTTVEWRCPSCGWRSDPDGFVGSPGEGPVAVWLRKGSEADDPEGSAALLSDRERAVVRHIARGLSNQEIADHLVVSINTVKTTIRTAYAKMGVQKRTEAMLWAFEHGLAEPEQ